ncbi:transcription antitermination factor NusB [uncultured Eudoraea sp.]|uniref:transcription antitermination factor NusB n=1 Tax=uncultured Eudoraea sp. TaxID=1035614 RepID=UPI002635F03E|nr:transcription antitermination factor NusB [uncultured Eudoraea sp.]
MLTRRQIRVKVMQCIYALTLSHDESLEKQKKFLRISIDNTYILYLLVLSLLMELHKMEENFIRLSFKKYIHENDEKYPNKEKFLNNAVLNQIVNNSLLQNELVKRKLNNWDLHQDYVKIVFNEIKKSELFEQYMLLGEQSYEDDKNLIANLFKEVIAPNERIYEYFEDDKLTWVDDIPLVNTFVLKQLRKVNEEYSQSFFLPKLLKDSDDMVFADQLLTKTLLNNKKFEEEIQIKTPNWDKDRIADIDAILLKMAICELTGFSSIPERVTINEYLEIAKEYSTPKSSIFINGILDKLVKEYRINGKLKKTGRGLL